MRQLSGNTELKPRSDCQPPTPSVYLPPMRARAGLPPGANLSAIAGSGFVHVLGCVEKDVNSQLTRVLGVVSKRTVIHGVRPVQPAQFLSRLGLSSNPS